MGAENNKATRRELGPPSFRKDFLASLVVFLVALPLCMGIALASGAPMAAGLITGIIGGLIVGTIAGSPLQVSGPAAGLTVVVLNIVNDPRLGLGMLGVVVLFAGALQLVSGLLRLGQWFRAVSPAVIQGMLAGIGIIIIAKQFHALVDDNPGGSVLMNLLTIPLAIWKGIEPVFHYFSGTEFVRGEKAHVEAALVGLTSILILILWKPLVPKKVAVIPAPLVAIVVATALTAALQLPIDKVTMQGNLWEGIRWPWVTLTEGVDLANTPWWGVAAHVGRKLGSQPVLLAVFTVAAIASAETLLCASAVDRLHDGPRTNFDRELAAQGVGNLCCGLVGALPMTGVIVRSSANVEAGATTRKSAILHGFWLLLLVALAPGLLALVPKAGLAAILVYTGFKLVNIQAIKTLWKTAKSEAFIYAATVLIIVVQDLLAGVIVGIVLSAIKLLYRFSKLKVSVVHDDLQGQTILYLRGSATFLRLPKLAAVLESVPPATELHVHMEGLNYVDHACLELLMDWEKQHAAQGGSLVMDWGALNAKFDRSLTSLHDMEMPGGALPKEVEKHKGEAV